MSSTTRAFVLAAAIIGFLFDTYELLMMPVIGSKAISDLLQVKPDDPFVRLWIGRILWIAALCGGVFGLLGGWMIDRYGRKRVMMISILVYSLSPVLAAFSTSLTMFVVFRCTTFVGVCVEMVAAVTWLAELFQDKRSRERAIAWSLAAASLGGLLVSIVYKGLNAIAADLPAIPTADAASAHAAWRYTLLTGLVPGLLILALMPKVPESTVWMERKLAGKLKRPSIKLLFAPQLKQTTIVMTVLSACAYAAAFGALQLTPSQVMNGRPEISKPKAEVEQLRKEAPSAERDSRIKALNAEMEDARGNIQLWQEVGGLLGRILLAVLIGFVPARLLLRLFVMPGALLFMITYLEIVKVGDFTLFAAAIFACGLCTVAQFSFLSEYLPKVYPLFLRGTGSSFATNIGGRMIGTMAAVVNTELLAGMYGGGPMAVAKAAAIIGGTVYLIAFIASFYLPEPAEKI